MERLLGLVPDERKTVGLAAAAAATASAGLTVAASSIDALLFARGGVDDLPVLYVFLGVTMFVATLGVSAVLGRLGRGRTFLVIPASIALIAGVARVALATDVGSIYPALWLLRGASEFLLGLAVWGLAGLVTDTRQAKRFFPLIGGAAVLGQVVGGLATKPLAGGLGTDNLILVWLATLGIVVVLGRKLVAKADADAPPPRRRRISAMAEMKTEVREGSVTRCDILCFAGCRGVDPVLAPVLLAVPPFLPRGRRSIPAAGRPRRIPRPVLRRLDRRDVAPVAPRDESPAVHARCPHRDDGPAGALPPRVRGAHGRLDVRDPLAFRFAQVVWLQGGASSAWEAVINTVPGDRRDRMRAFLYGGPTRSAPCSPGSSR